MTDMADRELLEAKGDPVLDAYVARNGPRDSFRDPRTWDVLLSTWRAAWQEAIEREWLPIETAPKDSKARLVYCPENKCTFCVSFDARDGTWIYFGGGGTLCHEPSHWKPLPEAPRTKP